MLNKKKLLLIAKRSDAKDFLHVLYEKGLDVNVISNYSEALEWALAEKPGVIVFLVPVYWESIIDFVTKIKNNEETKETQILYIGKLIEGADLTILQKYNVKTMALGPVPKQEMARYISDLF